MRKYSYVSELKTVAVALSALQYKVVFVGGAIVDFYCDDPARGEVRPTNDIDVVVELLTRGAHADLEEQLRQIGFQHDIESQVICRYKYQGLTVDVMPTDVQILGFTNRWYEEGVKHTIEIMLEDDINIAVFNSVYFLASKLEALKSERHGADFRVNSDFEDIVYIFDNRLSIIDDIFSADKEVKTYMIDEINQLLKRRFINEEITANLEFTNRNERRERILAIWQKITR